jgi:hypothetical protein
MIGKIAQIHFAHSGSLSINCDIAHQLNAERPGLLRATIQHSNLGIIGQTAYFMGKWPLLSKACPG